MRGISIVAPLAIIKRPNRVDSVFLMRDDVSKAYPADSSVTVYAEGGVIIAAKLPGPTSLTIAEGVDLDKFFRE